MGGKLLAAALDSDSKKEFIAKYNGFVKKLRNNRVIQK